MRIKTLCLIIVCWLMVSPGVGAEKKPDKAKNVLFLCIDDLRPELHCFGATYIHSPNIDRLAAAGRSFHRHYVNAPSCGPSRCTLLTGRYGAPGNDALFLRAKQLAEHPEQVPPSMPEWFRNHGYTTVSVGKVSHHPGGRGGKFWDDDAILEVPKAWDRHLMPVGEWENPLGAMHGLAHGKIRKDASQHDVFESAEGPDNIYPDGLIAEEGVRQLEELAAGDKPFFLAIGLIKPHLPFGAPKKYMDLYDGVELPPIPHPEKPQGETTWHASGEFMKYNRWGKDPRIDQAFATEVRRHYAACVSYADKHVGDILAKLKETGADKNTIIVLWGDHGWHLGEHSIWGKHSLFEESLRSPLIIYVPGMDKAGEKTNAVVETLDIFPTLCDLTGLSTPDFVQGTSLVPMLKHPKTSGHAAIAYQSNASTLRTDRYRLISHESGAVELYDHRSPEKETLNIAAQHPGLVAQLKKQIADKRNGKSDAPQEPVSLKEAHQGTLDIDLKMMNQFVRQPQVVQNFYVACREALGGENPDADIAAIGQQFKRPKLGGPMLGDITDESVTVWMHLSEPAMIHVDVIREGSDVVKRFISNSPAVFHFVHCKGLSSETTYTYKVVHEPSGEILGKGRFVTAPTKVASKPFQIAFGADFHKIGLHRPELMQWIQQRGNRAMLLLGDSAVDDRENDLDLIKADYLLRDLSPSWQQLSANVPIYATWDDHDYFNNDKSGAFTAGGKAILVNPLRQIWKEQWNNPEREVAREGIYYQTQIGPVHLIALDTRSCREGDRRGQLNSYLGQTQMNWLKKQLSESTAPYILVTSGTMWSDYITPGKDSWGTWDTQGREEILQLIDQKENSRVILLSGDRHGARAFAIPRPGHKKIYEFEVGTLGGVPGPPALANNTDDQLFGYPGQDTWAFGELSFDAGQVTFRLINEQGKELETIILKKDP